ncbi:MAG: hypothetical protein LBH40_05300 [Alphaproteobacteria bacterium]|jgi:hypothetical protein|nr:hypothetical protein [Alphaproteobacteria bacterium]
MKKQKMFKFIIFLVVIFIAFCFSSIQKSFAGNIYFQTGVSLNSANNLKISTESQEKLFQDFTVDNTSQSEAFLICSKCPGSNSTYPWFWIYKQMDIREITNFAMADNKINITSAISKQRTPSYSFSVGYKFLQNLRVEGEFRTLNLKSTLNELFANLNSSSHVRAENNFFCSNSDNTGNNGTGTPNGNPQKDPTVYDCTDFYSQNFNSTEEYDINAFVNQDVLKLNPNDTFTINSSTAINYYFLNFFFDMPLSFYNIGIFTGVGAGMAQININSTTNLPIKLSGKASGLAYQYKVGTYYNIHGYENLRLLASLTNISTLGKIKSSTFELDTIKQSSVDFSLMYIW